MELWDGARALYRQNAREPGDETTLPFSVNASAWVHSKKPNVLNSKTVTIS